jgi:hypothetical protein
MLNIKVGFLASAKLWLLNKTAMESLCLFLVMKLIGLNVQFISLQRFL